MAAYYYLVNAQTEQYVDLGKLCVCQAGHSYYTRVGAETLIGFVGRTGWRVEAESESDLDFLDTYQEIHEAPTS